MVFYHSEEYLYKMNFIQNEIVLGVLVFTIAVNLMVFIILGARKLLVSSGNISISMNDAAKSIDVEAGGKLLQTLAAQNLFLSSACGGGGTCAQCKCKVLSGGGSILPTEESHFTNKEKKEGWRLSCQVPVKDDMEIVVPDEVFGARKWECEVISNKNVATFIKELVLKLPEGEEVAFKALNATSSPSGNLRTSSLIKVATFLFEITSHSHFLAPKTSSGTTISISSFTGTWQDSLQPSFFSLLVK